MSDPSNIKAEQKDARSDQAEVDVYDAGKAPVLPPGVIDPVYAAKAQTLNNAIQELGMGRYQWELFALVSFGWSMDNSWPIVTSLLIPPISSEFNPDKPPLLSLSQNIGLLVGAVFWGFSSDIWGRKIAFNMTIGITSVFGLISAGSPNFAAICTFAALWSVGVGGNLPVDSAVFLEFLPGSHQYLLVILSIFWAFAQLVATLIAWPLLGSMTCEVGQIPCTKKDNMGWRYFVITMGGIAMVMFFLRFVCFKLHESPKYLMGKGRDAEAVEVVHRVAAKNGKVSNLTLEDLQKFDDPHGERQEVKNADILKRELRKVDASHVKALFSSPKLAWSTSLLICIWAFIGLGFPLYNSFLPSIQRSRGADFGDGSTYLTYRNSLIIACMGIPGAIVGAACVELPRFGRKGTLAVSTVATGAFLFASTTATNSNALLGWNCAFNFCSNVMYAVLYALTPESFPTIHRGTGNALTATANRVFGIMAPIVAIYANLDTPAPVYVSGALFIVAGFLVILLPFETQGRASM